VANNRPMWLNYVPVIVLMIGLIGTWFLRGDQIKRLEAADVSQSEALKEAINKLTYSHDRVVEDVQALEIKVGKIETNTENIEKNMAKDSESLRRMIQQVIDAMP